jgi:hypothetical protein
MIKSVNVTVHQLQHMLVSIAVLFFKISFKCCYCNRKEKVISKTFSTFHFVICDDYEKLQCHQGNGYATAVSWTGLKHKPSFFVFRVVFWDILPCKMIVDRHFTGAYCLHHQGWVSLAPLDIILPHSHAIPLSFFYLNRPPTAIGHFLAYRLSPRLATQALDSYITSILSY